MPCVQHGIISAGVSAIGAPTFSSPDLLLPALNRFLLPILAVLLLAATALALTRGVIAPSASTWGALFADPGQDPAAIAILELRLPRVLMAILVGATLAQAGALTQALFRNPLAEPGLIGVSAGAALAAAAVFALAVPLDLARLPFLLPVAAFAGALLTSLAVKQLAGGGDYTSLGTLLLAGAAVNAFVAAAVGLIASWSDDDALRGFTLWMFGNLGRAGWTELAWMAPPLLALLAWLPREARALDALLLGEAEASHLGIAVESLKRRILLLIVLGTACAVALAGLIGFIGLVVPHAVRMVVGPAHRRLLPAAALLGALLLVLADTAARRMAAPAELPVGVLTALLGAPFFMLLLRRWRRTVDLP